MIKNLVTKVQKLSEVGITQPNLRGIYITLGRAKTTHDLARIAIALALALEKHLLARAAFPNTTTAPNSTH